MTEKKKSADIIVKVVILLLIAALVVGSLISMSGKNTASGRSVSGNGGMPSGTEQQAAAITVSAAAVVPSDINTYIKINGDVDSRSQINIYPDTSGKITRYVKNIGDSVSKGDIIAYVDPSKPGSSYAVSPVISTVSGTVISRPYNPGDTVTTQSIIASVGSLDDLQVTAYVSEKYSATVKNGLSALVSFVPYPDTVFEEVVTQVSPVVDAVSRTVEVKLEFRQKDSRVRPGMFAVIQLNTAEEKDTIVVPKSAVKTYYDEQVVYTVDGNNYARRQTVTTGISNDSEIQILSGLSEGDVVITAGSAADGTLVRIVK